jgi:TPR repeat protein
MSLAMNDKEVIAIDRQVEQMLNWAKIHQAEAEQLALDSTRLLACPGGRLEQLADQGFFRRCRSRFSCKAGAAERADTADLIQMQKTALRFINMISEHQILTAHSLLALKNNLLALAVKEEETRNLAAALAQLTLERVEKLENHIDKIEISANLQGWLLGLEERGYAEKFPAESIRLFQVINNFYSLKNDAWTYNDLMLMKKALRSARLDPDRKISLNLFINQLIDDIYLQKIGMENFNSIINYHKPINTDNYSVFVVNEISSPIFIAIHGLNTQYNNRLDEIKIISDQMNVPLHEALKILLRKSIEDLNVSLEYEFSLAEAAIEILGCLRLSAFLSEQAQVSLHFNCWVRCSQGEGTAQDKAESVKWLRSAAEKDHAEAQFRLGIMYYDGEGAARNMTEALKWIRLAAEQGHAEAQCSLGVMYFHGKRAARNWAEAVKRFRLDAEQGFAQEQPSLGVINDNGPGEDQLWTESVKWLRLASDLDFCWGQSSPRVMNDSGPGPDQNLTEAVKWFRLAAEQGHAEAQCSLGLMYVLGQGADRNWSEAVKWLRLAAEQGYARGQCCLGAMYDSGPEADQNLSEAAKWYRLAAEQGYAPAQGSLGLMYERGPGADRNWTEAIKWYRLAAEQGYAPAQCSLGLMYANGRGADQNWAEALKWLRLAAEQGHSNAQFSLGNMYYSGPGADRNWTEAFKWYSLAAEQGNAAAQRSLAERRWEDRAEKIGDWRERFLQIADEKLNRCQPGS